MRRYLSGVIVVACLMATTTVALHVRLPNPGGFVPVHVHESTPLQDLQALLSLTAGVTNKDPTWTASTPACEWMGVTCNNTTGIVDSIRWTHHILGTMNFSSIPSSTRFFTLDMFSYIYYSFMGELHGVLDTRTLPRGLLQFHVSWTAMTGIVDEHGLPPNLQGLFIDANKLTGTLDFSALPTTLVNYDVSGNPQLTPVHCYGSLCHCSSCR